MSEMLKTMVNRIEHNKNALKTKRYYVEDLISNEELIILVEEIERLNNIIKQIYKIFEEGRFEDNCDCIMIEELITRELKGSDKNE